MSESKRLADVQAALVQRGVKDVKFFIQQGSERPLSAVKNDAAAMLEAFIDNRTMKMPAFNDSVKRTNQAAA